MAENHDDLKKELKKKKRDFGLLKKMKKLRLEREKLKIKREKESKLNKSDKKLEGKLELLENKKVKVDKALSKREKVYRDNAEKREKKIQKEAEKAEVSAVETTQKEILHARKELISIKKRVYSRRRKIINLLQFIGVLYLFVLSVILIKDVALALSQTSVEAITRTVSTDTSAFGTGWLGAIIVQSASVIAILTNSLVGADIITFDTAFYILLGLALGNSVTPVLASLVVKTSNHWPLRRGFELGLANVVYSTFLIIVVFIVQATTSFFTTAGKVVAESASNFPSIGKIPDLLSLATDPVINLFKIDQFPLPLTGLIGVGLLMFSLGRVGKAMFVFLGGKRHTRAIMEKHLGTHWKAFLIGLGLTIIIPSSSLLVTLMVPLAIARVVTLRQAIPYMIGTSVGTFIDVLLAAFANAHPYAIAGGVVLTLISSFGILFIFGKVGTSMIYKTTRYLSLHVIKIRKRNILKLLAIFILIPAIIVVLF